MLLTHHTAKIVQNCLVFFSGWQTVNHILHLAYESFSYIYIYIGTQNSNYANEQTFTEMRFDFPSISG